MQKTKSKSKPKASKRRAVVSAQQTIPYVAMHPDGICQLPGGLYTKTVEYEDINYAVASTEDQAAIFGGWSSFLNYFDSSLPFQLSFVNRRSRSVSRYKVNIPAQQDSFNSIRGEFVDMLKGQIAKSNNGIERSKYITFGLPAGNAAEARPRLDRVEADVMGNFKRLGVQSRPLDGRDRLAALHGQLHPGSREPFRFSWKDIPKTGMGTKDFIAPDSFDFRQSRTFRVGQSWGAVSYLQILASEMSDKLLAEILELDAELTVTLHVQTVDQLKAMQNYFIKLVDIDLLLDETDSAACVSEISQKMASLFGFWEYNGYVCPLQIALASKDVDQSIEIITMMLNAALTPIKAPAMFRHLPTKPTDDTLGSRVVSLMLHQLETDNECEFLRSDPAFQILIDEYRKRFPQTGDMS